MNNKVILYIIRRCKSIDCCYLFGGEERDVNLIYSLYFQRLSITENKTFIPKRTELERQLDFIKIS